MTEGIRVTSVLVSTVLTLVFLAALTANTFAQTAPADNEMQAAVRMLLLADPRAAGLPQAQLDEMVNALAKAAEKKGLTASEITWHPQPVSNFSQSASIGEIEHCDQDSILCMINEAFGFTGSDARIPVLLGICSAALVLVLGAMLEIRHRNRVAAVSVK